MHAPCSRIEISSTFPGLYWLEQKPGDHMSHLTISRLAAIMLCSIISCTSLAAEQAIVHAVQAPAWIERAGGIVALRVGAPLLAGDVIRTGPGGRVQVDLPEGSRVKLGEEVNFQAERLQERNDESGGIFDAAFNVLKGAFRFTTGLAGAERRRDVGFRVGAVTAGIRGTDIWGKSMDDGTDLVLLIEGEVELAMDGHEQMMMRQPLHGVIMLPDGEMQLIEGMAMEDLQRYAAETELNDERAMMLDGGEWQLVLMSLRDPDIAEQTVQSLLQTGFPAVIERVNLAGGEWHRVVLSDLASVNDARMQGEMLQGRFGIQGYWVNRQ